MTIAKATLVMKMKTAGAEGVCGGGGGGGGGAVLHVTLRYYQQNESPLLWALMLSHLNGFGLQVTRQCQKTLKVREASGGVGVE